MHIRKWQLLLGSMVITISLLFSFGSTAFAATTVATKAANVAASINNCPPG